MNRDKAIEAPAARGYRSGKLTHAEAQKMLGLTSRLIAPQPPPLCAQCFLEQFRTYFLAVNQRLLAATGGIPESVTFQFARLLQGGRGSRCLPDSVWVFCTDDDPCMIWVRPMQSFKVYAIERNHRPPCPGRSG